jgi:cytoskeletal protein CcmA (bactofilin family)
MFNSKTKAELPVEFNGTSLSNIGAGTTIKGDISCSADLRIDGILKGNIVSTEKIIIGPNGFVEGDVTGDKADINGKVSGTIKVKDLLQLKGNSIVNGNIYAGKLQVEPTAIFNGECHMGGASVVEMSNLESEHALAK